MAIRRAKIDDIPHLLALAEWMHRESPRLSRLEFSQERTEQMIRVMLNDADSRFAVFVAERKDGALVGFIAGYSDSHYTSKEVIALVSMFFMLAEARASIDAERLVCVMRSWAAQKGAAWVEASVWTGIAPEQTVKLYQSFGYSRCSIGLEASPSTGEKL